MQLLLLKALYSTNLAIYLEFHGWLDTISWVAHSIPFVATPDQDLKVTVYSLLMNYSYETVFAIGLKVYCWHKFQ